MPSSTVEDYLKCILLHQEQGTTKVSTGTIAHHLNVTPATVTSMLKTLSASRLAHYEPYSGVRLTAAGRQLATHVLRRHRLIELFLVQVLGMDWSEVHEEAELLEHAASDRLIAKMDEYLGSPLTDPHGDPIPNSAGEVENVSLPSLVECAMNTSLTVARITNQDPEFLRYVQDVKLLPGNRCRVLSRLETADYVEVEAIDGVFRLGYRAAAEIRVHLDPPTSS